MALIRLLLRVAGFLLIAAAFVVLVIDGTRVIAGGPLAAASLGELLVALDAAPGTASGLPEVAALLWDWLLDAPAFAVLGVAGVVLMALGHSRRSQLPEQSWRA